MPLDKNILYAGRDYYIRKGNAVRNTRTHAIGHAIGSFEEDPDSIWIKKENGDIDMWYFWEIKLDSVIVETPKPNLPEEECDKLMQMLG